MKIAVPTNDQDKIMPRSGRARGFLVFTIDGLDINNTEYRKNPHKHHHHEEEKHEHSHGDLMGVLKDCDVMVGNMVGSHLKEDLKKAGIAMYLTKAKNVLEAVHEYLSQL